ncbi:S8 family peptidase [Salinibacterium hongtaonis]|uniref:S8 family peptidase n=1 Tax=Homoserinimonas hongtaonis TaxID=2079791 RepID=UPI001E55A2B8|nr:S8 family serine peptidase [Salinibacterium hongtaonis]
MAVAAVVALSLPASAALAAPSDDPSSKFEKAESRGQVSATVNPLSADSNGNVTVVVELAGDPVAVVQAEKGRDLTKAERSSIEKTLEAAQQPVVDEVAAQGGAVEATMQSAYNGVQATIPAAAVDAVAAIPGVIALHSARTYTVNNAVSVPFLGVPQVWQSTGYTGENVKVAIIDTGIDYTHANFGGPGTVEAYETANAAETQPADPALFGPDAPRIKGGWDFVGDDYNADDDTSVPAPDPNPLDCNGHGSHVAGTTGGNGVTEDGATYNGPYDESTASQEWKIGPGVAPQVDLYALRVFGCAGSTNVTVAAIDWAVANDMDVINMSLGSSFGRADDPEAVASANAIGAGVVVVASAGNAGPSPYITGSPGSGEGVISVAAVDSTESFPGASVTVNGVVVPAINANGADLSGIPALTVVRLVDNPATAENEALGCSTAAYTSNGVVAGGNQLAVMERGTCARAAKPIFAQQAGAAAALMVNNTNDYPPFEGEITSNPDTGEAFTVTIPFLGVRLSDGAAFVTGAPATIAAAELQNPGFSGYASFSSNGPRSGDSGVGVDVAAPGVSIVSTGVGTGNGPATISGTSMAAPHVAGVAALTVQAHPGWKAGEIAAAVVSSADPEKVVGQQMTRGGVGLVDTAQAVATQVTATGDAFRTDSGWLRESALSFGFQESWVGFAGLKTITLTNHGNTAVSYKVSSAPSAQSEKAKISLSRTSVKVPAKGKATVIVALTASASAVGSSSVAGDPFGFYEFSGDVVLTSDSSTLRVPYLLVPRADARVASSTKALFTGKDKVGDATKSVKLTNTLGSLAAGADVYTWGLSDAEDVPKTIGDTGFDLASAGVQSFDAGGGDQLLVFAANTHKRWSNAASNEFDVIIDRNGDGNPEAVVFSADSGLVRAGDPNGRSEVFVSTAAGLFAAGFYAQAPTDSSTILLPVYASDLGLTAGAGSFGYSVASYSITNTAGSDQIEGFAAYDPWAPAIENGQFVQVPRNGSVSVPVAVNGAALAAQKPLGLMAVVIDNKSGTSETVLVKTK